MSQDKWVSQALVFGEVTNGSLSGWIVLSPVPWKVYIIDFQELHLRMQS